MTGTLSVGGTHSDTDKELYVNGDIEATATLEVGGATTLSDTLDVSGVTTLSNIVKLPATSAFLTHTAGTAGALKISSDLGYVEVEDIRFIGNSIGVNGADLIGLTSSDVTLKGDLKINDGTNDMFVVSASSGNTEVSGTLSVGGTHADTSKELYVNGDIEATATLEVGGATTLSSTLDARQTPR